MKLIHELLADEIKSKGGVWMTIHGNSMYPAILDSQKVYIVNKEKIEVDDIIAYYFLDPKGKLHIMVHRALFVRKTYVLTKGDNNLHILSKFFM